MSAFKPLLPVGGQPAILRLIRTAEAAGVCEIIVVTGHKREDLEKVLYSAAPDVRIIHNYKYKDGMFSSACAGVSALPGGLDGFFLLPADCCAVSKESLETLVEHFAGDGMCYVTRPKYAGQRGHPPLIPAWYAEPLCSYSGENGLKGFLSPLPTVEVGMGDPCTLLDMDTPEDYTELLTYLHLPVYPALEQCAELLAKYNASQDIIEHGKQVAAVALKIAGLMGRRADRGAIQDKAQRGGGLDLLLLESACLLHDIKRAEPDHARAGMELLLREGYPKAAALVGQHMDLQRPNTEVRYASSDDQWLPLHGNMGCVMAQDYKSAIEGAPTQDCKQASECISVPKIGEAELLYLADKLCRRGKITRLDDIMRELEAKFSQNPEALAGARKRITTARAILEALTARYGIGYADITIN